jgi:predicted Zn finger-like uncharacterized protein
MIVTCRQCATRYRIAESKLPPGGKAVRCSKCGFLWVQLPEAADQLAEDAPHSGPVEEQASSANSSHPKGRRLAVFTAFLGLAMVVVLVVCGLVHYRNVVVRVWPQSATLYRAVGIVPN